jgi:adenylosuccinate lyase
MNEAMMAMDPLQAISPIDGRYNNKTEPLQSIMSEYGLIKYRVQVEIEWLLFLCKITEIPEIDHIDNSDVAFLHNIITDFSLEDARKVKAHEAITNHDVKAVEYYIRDKISGQARLAQLIPWIHFACTSEDINNVAYALMLRDATAEILTVKVAEIVNKIKDSAKSYSSIAMMSRTHGQTASPTTLGKEFANFVVRLQKQLKLLQEQKISAKFNGAVGNYNAHISAYPKLNWPKLNKNFIESLGLEFNAYTTQIEPHDCIAELMHNIIRINNILLDLCRDMWGYISLGYFGQEVIAGEVGSSTMPHKVNPIDFENAEGNLGICNALADHLANKLPISRWQRDLSDSTVLRNLGSIFAYALIAYVSCSKGLAKCKVNKAVIAADLNNAWELLAEPIQTILRKENIANAYEKLKELSRGQRINKDILHKFIDELDIKQDVKTALKLLTPENYIGSAIELADAVDEI